MKLTRYRIDYKEFDEVEAVNGPWVMYAEVEALVRRLVPYLDHRMDCQFGTTDTPDGDVCTCDYGALKAETGRLLT